MYDTSDGLWNFSFSRPCLSASGLVPAHFGPDNDTECAQYGVGFTDIVARCTRAQSELSKEDFDEGVILLGERLRKIQPLLVVFNGKQIWARFIGRKLKDVECGVQSHVIEDCSSRFYVMTNSSPLNAHFPTAKSRMFYYEEIKAQLEELQKSKYFSGNLSVDDVVKDDDVKDDVKDDDVKDDVNDDEQ